MDRLTLVEIDSLRLYENPEDHHVAEIVQSLERTGTLIDPVIVDPDRRMLIDGHHRVRAFQLLGQDRIPAYMIDYRSSSVAVRNWTRVTDAPSEVLARESRGQPSNAAGSWTVRAMDGEGALLTEHEFEDPRSSAQYVHLVTCRLEVLGFTVSLRPDDHTLETGKAQLCGSPVISKPEVMESVEEGVLFPYEVNRHLIDRRPLEIDFPMSAVTSGAAFRDHLDRLTAEHQPVTAASGYRQGDRIYEEQVIVFRARGLT